MLSLVVFLTVQLFLVGTAMEEMETITGSIYCDNNYTLYINGELIARDPFPVTPHNAGNVTFRVPRGKDITFAIEARDWSDDITGLEGGNRCVGDGGLIAMFSNGVVTNSSWVCTNHHYGPINWKECVAAQMVRNQSLQLLPGCIQQSTPPLVGCTCRVTPIPEGWTEVGFDDSRWDFALEYTEDDVGWGVLPPGCDTGAIISTMNDTNGDPVTCPQNVDWGEAKFIWRPDLDLDNRILCRYTLKLEDSGAKVLKYSFVVSIGVIAFMLSII